MWIIPTARPVGVDDGQDVDGPAAGAFSIVRSASNASVSGATDVGRLRHELGDGAREEVPDRARAAARSCAARRRRSGAHEAAVGVHDRHAAERVPRQRIDGRLEGRVRSRRRGSCPRRAAGRRPAASACGRSRRSGGRARSPWRRSRGAPSRRRSARRRARASARPRPSGRRPSGRPRGCRPSRARRRPRARAGSSPAPVSAMTVAPIARIAGRSPSTSARRARVRHRDHDVPRRDDADVAVERPRPGGGTRGRARRDERAGDLLGDLARLPHRRRGSRGPGRRGSASTAASNSGPRRAASAASASASRRITSRPTSRWAEGIARRIRGRVRDRRTSPRVEEGCAPLRRPCPPRSGSRPGSPRRARSRQRARARAGSSTRPRASGSPPGRGGPRRPTGGRGALARARRAARARRRGARAHARRRRPASSVHVTRRAPGSNCGAPCAPAILPGAGASRSRSTSSTRPSRASATPAPTRSDHGGSRASCRHRPARHRPRSCRRRPASRTAPTLLPGDDVTVAGRRRRDPAPDQSGRLRRARLGGATRGRRAAPRPDGRGIEVLRHGDGPLAGVARGRARAARAHRRRVRAPTTPGSCARCASAIVARSSPPTAGAFARRARRTSSRSRARRSRC